MNLKVHSFKKSFINTNTNEIIKITKDFLMGYFWGAKEIICANSYIDRKGGDAWVIFEDYQIPIDYKVRGSHYGDFLDEIWSDEERRKRGWSVDYDKITNYIIYLNPTKKLISVLPFMPLRWACIKNQEKWEKEYGTKRIPNYDGGNSWTTVNIPVPWIELFDKMREFSVEKDY